MDRHHAVDRRIFDDRPTPGLKVSPGACTANRLIREVRTGATFVGTAVSSVRIEDQGGEILQQPAHFPISTHFPASG
jgi:hypothetical protein